MGHSRANERIKCPISGCHNELVNAVSALQHSAHHILHTPSKLSASEVSPLCVGPSSGCPPFLFRTNGNLQPRIPCLKYAPAANRDFPDTCVAFSAGPMKKSSANSPSTNRPIVCPECYPNLAADDHQPVDFVAASRKKQQASSRPAVWSYNMKAHWRRLHGSSTIPAGLESALVVTEAEAHALKSP